MEKEFELKAFKIKGYGDYEIKYRLTITEDDGNVDEQDYSINLSKPIHSDLQKLFDRDLNVVAFALFGGDSLKVSEQYMEMSPSLAFVKVTGVSFAGKNDNIGVALSGEIASLQGAIQWKTKRIKYLTGQDELCARLTVLAELLTKEVNSYLFENKVAEISVFGE